MTHACLRVGTLALLLLGFAAPVASAQSVPADLVVESLVTTGLANPTDWSPLPDGRVLIAEFGGGLKLWVPALGAAVAGVGTIGSPAVELGGERGLFSIAVDPDFAVNGYVYAWSARATSPFLWLTRHTLNGDRASSSSTNLSLDVTSQHVILNDAPDQVSEHNGGTVRFGPDGMLYLSIGDDMVPCDAQDRTTLSGVVLRLDVAGLAPGGGGPASKAVLAPADNPFVTSADPDERLVIAWGLRNPFSFDLDPVTGDLFIADVGENLIEELDWFERDLGNPIVGRNFGWPWQEGTLAHVGCGGPAPAGLVAPIDTYTHAVGGIAIMAAGVYRNLGGALDWGPAYESNAFHVDFANGTITRLVHDAVTGGWNRAAPVPGQPTTDYWGSGFQTCMRFQVGPEGSMYFLDRGDGDFRRIRTTLVPLDDVVVLSGGGQVGVLDGTFKQPIVVQVSTPGGVPVANATVTFGVTGGSVVGPQTVTTNALGMASAMVKADAGGSIAVRATTPNGTAAGALATLFARSLEIVVSPVGGNPLAFVTLKNVTNGSVPVPFIFAMTQPSVPMVPTPYGLLGVSILDGNGTFVIEDPFCLLNCQQIAGGFGNPGKISLYDPSPLIGTTQRFQMVVVDPTVTTSVLGTDDSGIGFTNVVTVAF